jgi:D-alanine-D-alanine ligase
MKKKIALVAGGYSGEYVISVQSAVTIEHNIDPEKYSVYKIMIGRDDWHYLTPEGEKIPVDKNDFSLSLPQEKIIFDAVFIGIHGTPGEDGKLQGYLDMIGLPYTSCGAISSALTFNKSYCNKVVSSLGIARVARSVHLFREQPFDDQKIAGQLKFPVFVKPAEGGSSIGMSKVSAPSEELGAAIEKAFREDAQVLIEEFVKGREFTCGLFKYQNSFTVLPITEIISSKEFFDYEAKYTPGKSREITPAGITDSLREQIAQTACRVYDALNCRGITRIDFIYREETDELYFLEINTMPGQSENSIVPQQVRAAGMELKDFYGMLIEDCLERHAKG